VLWEASADGTRASMNKNYGTVIDTFTTGIEEAEVAVLMPVHNEADIIESVVLGFYETVSRRMPVEIVLSEDGSVDGTKIIIGGIRDIQNIDEIVMVRNNIVSML
jgi:hypothetical protein